MADFLFINPSSNPELLHQLLAVKSVAEAAPRQHVLGIRLPRAWKEWHQQGWMPCWLQGIPTVRFDNYRPDKVGWKECRLAVKHCTVDSRRQYVRGIRLPQSQKFWIVSELTAENILRLKKGNDNRFCPDAVSATQQELLTFACNLIWSESDETEVLSGSELPDTV